MHALPLHLCWSPSHFCSPSANVFVCVCACSAQLRTSCAQPTTTWLFSDHGLTTDLVAGKPGSRACCTLQRLRWSTRRESKPTSWYVRGARHRAHIPPPAPNTPCSHHQAHLPPWRMLPGLRTASTHMRCPLPAPLLLAAGTHLTSPLTCLHHYHAQQRL